MSSHLDQLREHSVDVEFSATARRLGLFLSFKWPSVAYALDILAWDFFFALSMFFAAPVFGGSRLAALIRLLTIVRECSRSSV